MLVTPLLWKSFSLLLGIIWHIFFNFKQFKLFDSQLQLSPEDTSRKCTNYPTNEFESYDDCVGKYIKKVLPNGMVPFWSTHNKSKATDSFKLDMDIHDHDYIENDLGKSTITI